jgi:hypothetical protein
LPIKSEDGQTDYIAGLGAEEVLLYNQNEFDLIKIFFFYFEIDEIL